MHDVGIVPDAFGGQVATADDHAVDRIARHAVFAYQRALIVAVLVESAGLSGSPVPIGHVQVVERVDVD